MKNRRKPRKVWYFVMTVFLIGLIACLLAAWKIHNTVASAGTGRIYSVEAEIPNARVALVLGARVYKTGKLSPMLADRVDTAIALYEKGVVDKLLVSGDNRFEHYNEVTAMRNYAIENGVPSNDVVRDFAGFRTYDSVYRAKEIWGLDKIIIVSQAFHLPRAIYIAEKLGVEATGVEAEGRQYPSSLRAASRREVLARILAWFDVLVGRDPYFLGPRESLSGDLQKTRVQEE